jgi:hypothetical protein
MFRLSKADIYLILDALSDKYGKGYSDDPKVGKLQAKLSIMLQAAVDDEAK